MLINMQTKDGAPHFEIGRGEDGVTLNLTYNGDDGWLGGLKSSLGEATAEANGAGGTPIVLDYTAEAASGETVQGHYTIENYEDGSSDTFEFTVTQYETAGSFTGTSAADYVLGSEQNDVLSGGAANDVFFGDGGQDTLAGGDGDDRIRAGEGNDIVRGDAGADFLSGNLGNDVLIGGEGDDVLSGRWGSDIVSGGAGKDTFVFATGLGATEVDTLTDFTSGEDKISLDVDIFAAFDGMKGIGKDALAITEDGLATEASQRLIYNSKTGELFYDADGSGAASSILFAKLEPGTEIGKGDFLLD